MKQNQETMKKKCTKFIEKHPNFAESQIAHHFMLEGAPDHGEE